MIASFMAASKTAKIFEGVSDTPTEDVSPAGGEVCYFLDLVP